MAYISSYGTLWGQIPNTAGRVFWVAPSATYTVAGNSYTASDGNQGLTPQNALLTLDYAVGLCTANAGDVIVMLPGAHSYSASVAVDVAGITIMGLPSGNGNRLYPKTTLTCTAVDQTINVTAADVEIAHILFIARTSQASAQLDFSSAANRLHIHHCAVDFSPATAATTILGFDATGAASYVLIDNCVFHADGAFGAGIDMTATLDSVVEDCDFRASAGTWAAAVTTGAATDRLLIRRCDFLDFNGTITAGVDGTGATIADGVAVHDCRFGENVTVPIDNYDAGECQIAENYDFGIGSTDGGALITAIT